MELPYMTEVDPTLPHQVVFFTKKETVHVSCNCLLDHSDVNGIKVNKSMGRSANLKTARVLYNNPKNHNKPFTQEDEAKW